MSTNRPPFSQLVRDPVLALAFGFGSGLASKAPGTLGTLVGVALYWPLSQLPVPGYLAAVTIAAVAGVYICGAAAQKLGVHDHGGIVWDEIVGIWVALAMLPDHPLWILMGFGLFRCFDILKPWPIRWLDKHVGGGVGIMLDDLVAGLMAFGVLLACMQLLTLPAL